MKIYTRVEIDSLTGEVLSAEFFDYDGPVAQCGGGKGGSAPPAPDYSQLSNASVEAAKLGKELGESQLAEAKRQYDLNRETQKPITEAQLGLMNETLRQGKDYYEYGLRGRPVEDQMRQYVLGYNPAADTAEREAIVGPSADILAGKYGQDISQQVGRAVADTRQGSAAQMNQLIRQGLRYGYSPQAMAARLQPAAMQYGLAQASAANQAREAGIMGARGMLGQGRSMRQQDEAINWAKQMDVAGLYRGMPGASQGAYGLALGAGTSALQNQMAPSAAYMGQRQGAYGLQQTGMGQQLQGLSALAGAQANIYGTQAQANAMESAGQGQMFGSLVGAGVTAAIAI